VLLADSAINDQVHELTYLVRKPIEKMGKLSDERFRPEVAALRSPMSGISGVGSLRDLCA